MKVAAPLAGGFIAYIAGVAIALFSLKKAAYLFGENRSILAIGLVLCGVAVGMFTVLKTDSESHAAITATDSLFVPSDSPNTPMGVARGIFPGRVVWMWDSTVTSWNGTTGNWWSDNSTNQVKVDSMLSRSLRSLAGKASDDESWDALFKYFNERHGKGSIGYQPGEKIAVKFNLNQISSSWNPGNKSFPSPHVVLSLLRQLVNKAAVPDSDVTFYDAIRYVPDPIYTKCKGEFPNVHFMGWEMMNGREKYVRDTARTLLFSQDLTKEINGGHPAYLPTVVTKAAYVISLANLKGHRYVGVTLCAKNHFGSLSCDSVDGTPYVYAPHGVGVHYYVAVHDITIPGSDEWTFKGRPMGSYNALVDLMGHKDLGGKTLLFMVDALYAVQTEQDGVSLKSKWLSPPFNNDWTSSLFLSQDNVAIESVGLDFIRNEQGVNPSNYTTVYGSVDNYLHEAALADNPPSGTVYDPERDGTRLQSLGVHEHWNNPVDKQYTRNLGAGQGIELFRLTNSVTSVHEQEVPLEYALFQNYPNPFNPSTTISFSVLRAGNVSLVVYDLKGALVRTLVSGAVETGRHSVQWDGKDSRGISVGSGVFFTSLRAGDTFVDVKKMVLLR
jgi:hypothetical protein